MMSLDEIKELRKQIIYKGKTQPGYAETKGKELLKKNKHAREKYCNPNNFEESGSINELDVEVLYGLVTKYNPTTIIEIGSWFGTSAMVMNQAAPNATIWTCDKHKLFVYDGSNINYRNTKSEKFYKALRLSLVKAEFVFMDGSFMDNDIEDMLQATTPSFTFVTHDYEKGEKGWRNIRAIEKKFPGVPVIIPNPKSCIAVMEIVR